VKDWSSVRVKLERSACLGTCPVYSVEISGDGTIHYEGSEYVTVMGRHQDTLSRDDLEMLLAEFRDAEFFQLESRYGPESVSDVPTVRLTVSVDGLTKSVADVFGVQAGMPQRVSDLQQAVDFHGHTNQWVFGEGRTAPGLGREQFDFRSEQAGMILARAAFHGDAEAVRNLIAAGAPLEVSGGPLCPSVALECSVHNHNVDVLRMLIAAGASKSDQAVKDRVLRAAIAKDQREAIRMLEDYGARRAQ
jgi:hypothetical protein